MPGCNLCPGIRFFTQIPKGKARGGKRLKKEQKTTEKGGKALNTLDVLRLIDTNYRKRTKNKRRSKR